jgi:hypothetical protein
MQSRSRQPNEQAANVQTAPQHSGGEALAHSGKVLETMNAGGYTYVHVDAADGKVWAAGPETTVEVGDVVSFAAGMEMAGFRSETLDRTFETIYFVPEIRTGGTAARSPQGQPEKPEGHPSVADGHPPVTAPDGEKMDFAGITVPSGGKSIANLYAEKAKLVGQKVAVRGKVVKFTAGVMGKNWVHLMDGTGSEGANDLTVTTDAVVRVGDVATAQGVLVADKDFGFGYAYEIIIENADVSIEF